MCESEKLRYAMLNEHVGKNVTIVLDGAQNNIFQGLLERKELLNGEELQCWVVTSDRGLMPHGHNKVAVPETKIYFVTNDLRYIIVPQETEKEAAEKIQSENIAISLASPGWGDTRQ